MGLECATLAEAAQLLKGADSLGLINLHILPHHQVLNRDSSVAKPQPPTNAAKPPVHYAPRNPERSSLKSSMRRKLSSKEPVSQERSSSAKGSNRRRPWSRDRSAGALEAESKAANEERERSRDPALRASAPDLHDSVAPRLSLPQTPNRRLVQRTSYPTRSRLPTKGSSLVSDFTICRRLA